MAVYRNIGLILVPAALLFGWIAWLLLKTGSKNSPETFILAGMFMAAMWGGPKLWAWAWEPATNLQQSARDRLMPSVFGFVENLRYRHGRTPDFIAAMPAKSILRFTRIQHDDMITGVHDGLPFSLAECTFWMHEGKSETKTFQGAVFHCKVAFGISRPAARLQKTDQRLALLVWRARRQAPAGGFSRRYRGGPGALGPLGQSLRRQGAG